MSIPAYVYVLYNLTHSLVVFAFVVAVLCLRRGRRWPWFIGSWGLHIGTDIFTHGRDFFPTPFLWPGSSLTVNRFSWPSPRFVAINHSALVVFYLAWYVRVRPRRRAAL